MRAWRGGGAVRLVLLAIGVWLLLAATAFGSEDRGDRTRPAANRRGARLRCSFGLPVYFAFGETDVYVVLDLPDNQRAAAASMAVNAAGGATSEVVVLLTPEDIDAAAKLSVDYRPPGS